jgi:hypothetical protein
LPLPGGGLVVSYRDNPSQRVAYYTVQTPFYDPLVTFDFPSLARYTRAFLVQVPGSIDPVVWQNGEWETPSGEPRSGPIPDDKRYVYNEDNVADWRSIRSHSFFDYLDFRDAAEPERRRDQRDDEEEDGPA